jgi:alpha-D-xyloside xylohydrolase
MTQPLVGAGGYWGGNPADPQFQELIVRWFQFGAFCPLFRLHGHRDGGPPSDDCGGTNGDNEVWNLAPDPAHYAGIVAVMHLRENLREYVADINAVTAATGMPMSRAMFLQASGGSRTSTTLPYLQWSRCQYS